MNKLLLVLTILSISLKIYTDTIRIHNAVGEPVHLMVGQIKKYTVQPGRHQINNFIKRDYGLKTESGCNGYLPNRGNTATFTASRQCRRDDGNFYCCIMTFD